MVIIPKGMSNGGEFIRFWDTLCNEIMIPIGKFAITYTLCTTLNGNPYILESCKVQVIEHLI